MTYEQGILEIPQQFGYQAEIVNKEKIQPFKKVIVLGMGGSRLGADILNMLDLELDIHIHSDYDLPAFSQETLASALIIANSYSGNTAEPISGAKMAIEKGLNLVIITAGGELGELANQNKIPHILLPHSELPPRMMVGHDLMALTKVIGFNDSELVLCQNIDADALRPEGIRIAHRINSSIPLIYTSERLNELGYIWKVILNETVKMPAFHNRLPEADHNEIAGFKLGEVTKFHPLFIKDALDERISERMDLTTELFQFHGMLVDFVYLTGGSLVEKIISSAIIAHWAALELSTLNNIEPLAVSEIENFKKQLS